MKKTLLALGSILLSACSGANPTEPRDLPTRASAIVDPSLPPPTEVAASATSRQGTRVTLQLSWTDNSNFADEWMTCFRFTKVGGGAGGDICAYASAYGSGTGPRTATGVIAKGTYTVQARVTREVQMFNPVVGNYVVYVESTWTPAANIVEAH